MMDDEGGELHQVSASAFRVFVNHRAVDILEKKVQLLETKRMYPVGFERFHQEQPSTSDYHTNTFCSVEGMTGPGIALEPPKEDQEDAVYVVGGRAVHVGGMIAVYELHPYPHPGPQVWQYLGGRAGEKPPQSPEYRNGPGDNFSGGRSREECIKLVGSGYARFEKSTGR